MQNIGILLGAALPFIGVGTVFLVVLFIIYVIYRKRQKKKAVAEEDGQGSVVSDGGS